jgi:hypothetical protein
MGLKRRGRYPAIPASAFDITRFSRTRVGREKVPGGATGGGNAPGIKPSLFFCFVFSTLWMLHTGCCAWTNERHVAMSPRQERGA